MPLFDFNTGGSVSAVGSNANISFTDNGVTFSLSTSGNPGASVRYYSGSGELRLGDTVSAGGSAPFNLSITGGAAPNSNFGPTAGGSISLKLGTSINGSWTISFIHATSPAKNVQFTGVSTSARVLSFATSESFSQIRFSQVAGSISIDSLNTSIVCYLEGTGIETPKGRVAVEDLRAGDKIVTADGGVTTVRWLGRQPVDTASVTPAKTFPICFSAGAIAPGVPARDLYVSPDHAMEIGGLLINASALVNGRSITQVRSMPQEGFTYYHIDTGVHELILAEGAASETYLDLVGRDVFINGHEMADAPMIAEMAKPRIVARRMVPGDVIDQLEARADALGFGKVARVA